MIAAFALAGVLTLATFVIGWSRFLKLVAFLRAEGDPVCILIAVLAGCPFVAGYVGGGF